MSSSAIALSFCIKTEVTNKQSAEETVRQPERRKDSQAARQPEHRKDSQPDRDQRDSQLDRGDERAGVKQKGIQD